ncbi:MAG: hypothetical protein Q9218_007969, partial [Villophora microphyllina]
MFSKIKDLLSSPRHKQKRRRREAKQLAQEYFNSFPGRDHLGSNTSYHHDARTLLQGKEVATKHLSRVLEHRLAAKRQATEYKNLLRPDFPDCEAFDLTAWKETILFEHPPPGCEKGNYNEYSQIMHIVHNAGIFDHESQKGWADMKPRDYLAVACLESGFDLEEVRSAMGMLLG